MLFDLPPCTFLLITDNDLSSPADFLLHRALHQHLKSINDTNNKAIILSVSEDLARWKAIASASRSSNGGLDLDRCIEDGSVEFITVLSHLAPHLTTTFAPFRPLFDILSRSLQQGGGDGGGLVILDDLSALEWIGYEATDVLRFVRALRAACIKAKATLVVRYHRISSDLEPEDDTFAALYQLCAYHVEVRGLASGRSGSVSGEIALHPGPAALPLSSREAGVRVRERSSAIQYKLTDAGAVFFEKGMRGL
ncbi:hypothetical protein APHAL10511_003977 [Amanita phalloides]|nr:hypothetical protein APHAL10511_003977 [Amanita phalloides]